MPDSPGSAAVTETGEVSKAVDAPGHLIDLHGRPRPGHRLCHAGPRRSRAERRPQSQLGTATSSSAFFRSIGGAFGVAVFGAIFNNRLAANLPAYLPPSALRAVHGSNISASPAQLDALPPAIHHGYVLAFSDSLHAVFLIGAPISLLAFALTWFLKDLPLRGHAYLATDDATPRGNAPPPPGRRQVVSHAGNWRRYRVLADRKA